MDCLHHLEGVKLEFVLPLQCFFLLEQQHTRKITLKLIFLLSRLLKEIYFTNSMSATIDQLRLRATSPTKTKANPMKTSTLEK